MEFGGSIHRTILLNLDGSDKLCNDTYILQREDWSSHKAECAGLKRVQGREHAGMPTDTMRLVLRLVVTAMASTSRQLELDSLVSSMMSCTFLHLALFPNYLRTVLHPSPPSLPPSFRTLSHPSSLFPPPSPLTLPPSLTPCLLPPLSPSLSPSHPSCSRCREHE